MFKKWIVWLVIRSRFILHAAADKLLNFDTDGRASPYYRIPNVYFPRRLRGHSNEESGSPTGRRWVRSFLTKSPDRQHSVEVTVSLYRRISITLSGLTTVHRGYGFTSPENLDYLLSVLTCNWFDYFWSDIWHSLC